MTTLAIAIGILFVIGWVVVSITTFLVGFASEAGTAARSLTQVSMELTGRWVAKSPPELSCESVVLDKNLPRPEKDSVVARLRDYAATKPTWPTWDRRWPSNGDLLWADGQIFQEEVDALLSCSFKFAPPYELLAERVEYPDPPAPPKDFETISEAYALPTLKLPQPRIPIGFFERCIRLAYSGEIERHEEHKKKHGQLVERATSLNAARRAAFQSALNALAHNTQEREASQQRFNKRRDEYLAPMKAVTEFIASGRPRDAALLHFDLVLREMRLPRWVPRQWAIDYDPESRTLLIEHRFPAVADADFLHNVKGKRSTSAKPLSKTNRKEAIARLQSALSLVIARTAVESDSLCLVDAIAVNGWVEFFDKATGHRSKAYCSNLICSKDDISNLVIATADPKAAIARLSGTIAHEMYEVVPTRPNLRLLKDDARFVAPRETLSSLNESQNLASMPWEDFEHLVRELFERKFGIAGAEVKITRASRDHGVDAIIFDSDPVRGGKIVVQAKRYTLPVDVSAVRDLYGTVVNEGANSGMLVTTSTFGPDAYAFAQNKPLKLFNGSQLLGLLEDVGFKFRIDLAEARRLLRNS